MKIGIVFEGGGGKGAYQIGVWKAIKELGIEPFITCASGTSVGALNAALFYKGNFLLAEEVWRGISEEDILHQKMQDDFHNGDCFFSQKKLADLIETSIRGADRSKNCKVCYVTCKYRDRNYHRYFRWSDYLDIELKKRILLASAAIPIVFESIEIDGEWYVDGGANGDNTPVKPLLNEEIDCLIVIHLSGDSVRTDCFHGRIIEIFPSDDLGGLITGTLDFDSRSVERRIQLGYYDAKNILSALAEECCSEIIVSSETIVNRKPEQKQIKLSLKREIQLINDYFMEDEMVEFKFTNEDARKAYESKLSALKKIADDQSVDKAYLWDATVEKYAGKISKVKKMLETEGINDCITTKMFKDMNNFLKRCSDAEFHIALVGAIKAGKSTLINALLGYEYASTKVTPETAALTKFKKGEDNAVRVTFYSQSEWNSLWKSAEEAKATVFLEEYAKLNGDAEKNNWLGKESQMFPCKTKDDLVNEIQKWTSSKSVCHYFVKEVEVLLEDFELPNGVVLVDTPGLDDVVEYRSNVTRDYIDRANAVLVCVKSDALTGQEMATIYSVFANTRYNTEKVYIIATQTDTLNRPIENWKDQREEWLKYLKGSGAFGSLDIAKKNLVAVSAHLYTLLNQYNDIKEEDDKYWELSSILGKFRIGMKNIHDKYQELLDFTNISLLNKKIQREIVDNYKQLLIDDIVGGYEICKESIRETMLRIKREQEELIKVSMGSIEEIRKQKEQYDRDYQAAEDYRKSLDELLKKVKMATTKRADDLENAIMNLR